MKLINYDSRTAQQCKCEVSIRHFNLILLSLLSLFFLVFSFLSVIFGLSEKRTILASWATNNIICKLSLLGTPRNRLVNVFE